MAEPVNTEQAKHAAPTPEAPIEGARVDAEAVTFSWRAVPGADDYQVQVAPSIGFEEPVLALNVGQATSYTAQDTFSAGDAAHYWRVRARHDGSWGPFSEVAAFTPAEPGQTPSMEVEAAAPGPQFVEGGVLEVEAEGFQVGTILVWLIGVVVTVVILVVLGFQLTQNQRDYVRSEFASTAVYPELRQTEAAATSKLTQYEVLDAEEGVYQIPITRAIDLMVNEARQNPRTDYSAELQLVPVPAGNAP